MDKVRVKQIKPKREEDFLTSYMMSTPKQSIGPLERGQEITEYSPVIRNLSSNLSELMDYTSPLDDVYEAAGGDDPTVSAIGDMVDVTGLGKSGLKGAAIVTALLKGKAPRDVVRLFHGSPTPVDKFVDPLTHVTNSANLRGPGFYTADVPSMPRRYTGLADHGGGYIYTVDIPREKFLSDIYNPSIAKTKLGLKAKGNVYPTDERLGIQEAMKQVFPNHVNTQDYQSVYPYARYGSENNIPEKDLARAFLLRDAGFIGHGPYEDINGFFDNLKGVDPRVYNLLETPNPTYKIKLEPEDYKMESPLFNEYIKSMLPPSLNIDDMY